MYKTGQKLLATKTTDSVYKNVISFIRNKNHPYSYTAQNDCVVYLLANESGVYC